MFHPVQYALSSESVNTDAVTVDIFAASAIGIGHRVRQDHYRFSVSGPWINVVVSDGVSSSRRSEQGAHTVVEVGIQLLNGTDAFNPVTLILQVNAALLDYAEENYIQSWELACTFSALRLNIETGEGMFVSVGDSAVIALEPNNEWSRFTDLAAPESYRTVLPSPFPERLEEFIATGPVHWPADRVLFVMTDGILNDIATAPGLSRYLGMIWSTPPVNLPAFLDSVLYELQYSFDDRTVVALWRKDQK